MQTRAARPSWESLPARVRVGVEELLGSPVVAAISQPGGFSPGSADRVRTADGRRAFVKAAGLDLNPSTPGIHRAEGAIVRELPECVPAPRLIGTWDDGDWIALVFEESDGVPPALPWTSRDIEATLDACVAIAAVPAPDGTRSATEMIAPSLGWLDRVRPVDLPELASRHRTRLASAMEAFDVSGDRLQQLDLRQDNVLLRQDGTVVIVDWPWAGAGPTWLDALTLLYNVRLYDSAHDIEEWLTHPAFDGITPLAIDATLATLVGLFLEASLLPIEPGIETVREFQRAQADVILRWLDERWREQ